MTIELYTANTPNGQKPAIMLEEIGLPYQIFPVNIGHGEQHTDTFLAINPNGKIPAIVDDGQRVFESGAILIYLAEKSGKLLPTDTKNRSAVLAWTFWQVGGLGPMIGQWGHFSNAAPEYSMNASENSNASTAHNAVHVPCECRTMSATHVSVSSNESTRDV